jgi:hypothetical protein
MQAEAAGVVQLQQELEALAVAVQAAQQLQHLRQQPILVVVVEAL